MSRYVNFGAGWLKENNGKQYISLVLGDQKNGVKVILRNDNGTEVEVSTAMIAFQEKRNPKSPDVRLTSKIED